jgi:putative component of membrane protein insertase Oxa1/YidC/SpoIIIJ protein YidD
VRGLRYQPCGKHYEMGVSDMARCEECLHYELCSYNTYEQAKYFGRDKEIYITIKNNTACKFFKPTADVVPKSEVEKLERTVKYLEGVCESLPDKVRAEVAREIISDMRKLINGYENIDIYLDRIEKKYTEEKKDG